MKATASAKTAFLASILKSGEQYAGIILGENGEPDYHLILIGGEAIKVSFREAKEFANLSGGELPTRREQALLYSNLKDEFTSNWYWSGELHASTSDYAWYQSVYYGCQGYGSINDERRARAVRRVAI